MEQWKKDFNQKFVTPKGNLTEITPKDISRFIEKLLKEERNRDKVQELIDYVKESKSNTEILIQYIFNNTSICEKCLPDIELLFELGIKLHDETAIILWILEKYFKEHPKP